MPHMGARSPAQPHIAHFSELLSRSLSLARALSVHLAAVMCPSMPGLAAVLPNPASAGLVCVLVLVLIGPCPKPGPALRSTTRSAWNVSISLSSSTTVLPGRPACVLPPQCRGWAMSGVVSSSTHMQGRPTTCRSPVHDNRTQVHLGLARPVPARTTPCVP
ncbi:hypothetical protein FKP32DRAFT_1593745 [Trametes sanguinea]|nr:hypothetical protein FKP32DRAFT_1593745 [Trametes sanguinea]